MWDKQPFMKIEIDKNSGFCFGVIKAIAKAEETLDAGIPLYSLGEIVHNGMEVERLLKKGMKTVAVSDFPHLSGATVLIRAHGEPPETYTMAEKYGIELIDATCPVVLKLQKKIRKEYAEHAGEQAQLVIYGRQGHAEVNGLIGQVGGDALVIEDEKQMDKVDPGRPVVLFSQTTKSLEGFSELKRSLRSYVRPGVKVTAHDTVCGQVSHRAPALKAFARSHDVIIFVSGKGSSNGKFLYEMCFSENPRSYRVESPAELSVEWFEGCASVGICGATSTPRWLMEEVANAIRKLSSDGAPIQ